MRICFFSSIVVLVSCFSCVDEASVSEIGTDTASINRGKLIFSAQCASCHNFSNRGIGPQLAGITDSVPVAWLQKFISDPQRMLNEKDERTVRLVREFKSLMPAFDQLSKSQVDDIISFIATKKRPISQKELRTDGPSLPTIVQSDIVIEVKLISQFPITSKNGKSPLARITKLDYLPGSGDLFVADMRGILYRLAGSQPRSYLDIKKWISSFVHEPGLGAGLTSFAFHPGFATNGLLYTAHSEILSGKKSDFNYNDSIKVTYQYVLTEWRADSPGAESFSGQSRELLRIDMVTVQHGIQEIAFNPYAKEQDPDYGKLFVCIGDGGAMDDKHTSIAGDPHMPWGTVFRIDPLGNNSNNGKYGVPVDNPFAQIDTGLAEVYAYGFRNPHRISWASKNEAFVANIGEAYIEAIYRLKPGMHHGWPVREGRYVIDPKKDVTLLLPMTAADSAKQFNYPIASYGHQWGYAGNSGGFVYSGSSIPSLRGKYVFGDIPSGKLFYFDIHRANDSREAQVKEWRVAWNGKPTSLAELCNHNRVDLHFGRDADGELYILTKADGKVYKLTDRK